MLIDVQTFERMRPLMGKIVADFVKTGNRPRPGSFTIPPELIDVVRGLNSGDSYRIGIEIDKAGPCRMRIVSIEAIE